MNKVFKLCSCELTKILKKKSTKIMAILLIISLFLGVGITALTKKTFELTESLAQNDYKTTMQGDIDDNKRILESEDESLDEASKNKVKATIDVYQYALNNDLNLVSSVYSYWKCDALMNTIYVETINMYNYKSFGDIQNADKLKASIDKMYELLKNDDFSGYMEYERESLKGKFEDGLIDKDTYEIKNSIIDLKEKYEIGKVDGEEAKWKTEIVNEIEYLKTSKIMGIDAITMKPYTEESLKKADDTLKIDEYRLEHNIPPYMTGMGNSIGESRKVYDYMASSVVVMILTVMMVIIAGTSISSEISKGTIKFWSFTPNKRWKILLSKLLACTIVLVATVIIISLISTVIGNIFFGADKAQGYLYVSNGTVHEINYVVYNVIFNLVAAFDAFVFMILALMLSTITRNTAVSVGISIAAYLGGPTIMQIVNLFVKADWIKFVPFNNLNLTDRLFTNDLSFSGTQVVSTVTGNIPVGFSLAVIGVCIVLMIVTMFDSFRKRDIV